MLKKLVSLFMTKFQTAPYVPPAPVRCYQPELPFE